MKRHYDVIIIGGGPAGLSAALMLGRCRRSVLVVDAEEPRNGASRALHGYLTQDGVNPWALRAKGRANALRYPGVAFVSDKVASVARQRAGFRVSLAGGDPLRARLLLLATGRSDPVPDLPG